MSKLIQVRTHRNQGYTTVNLQVVEDSSLSWAAKGLHLYLISRPPSWEIRHTDLVRRSTDEKFSLQRRVDELKLAGYLRITKNRDKTGKLTGTTWEVYEEPQNTVSLKTGCGENLELERVSPTSRKNRIRHRIPKKPDVEKTGHGKTGAGKTGSLINNIPNRQQELILNTPPNGGGAPADVYAFLDFACERFKKVQGNNLLIAHGKHGKLVKTALSEHGFSLETLKSLYEKYLGSSNDFYRERGFSLDCFLMTSVLQELQQSKITNKKTGAGHVSDFSKGY